MNGWAPAVVGGGIAGPAAAGHGRRAVVADRPARGGQAEDPAPDRMTGEGDA